MKYFLLYLAISGVALALAGRVIRPNPKSLSKPRMLESHAVAAPFQLQVPRKISGAELEFCDACIQVSVIMVNELLNILLNEGLIGECTTLCGKLPQKLEQEVCDAACVGLGLDEFIHVLERTDIDPIYYCELVRLCKIVDCQGQCLAITSLGVKPPQVELGGSVNVNVTFRVFNTTGTGMTRVDVYSHADPKMLPLQNDFLELGYEPGLYGANIKIDTSEATEFWQYQPGGYTVQVWFCEGECGSQHPHSKIYDVRNGTFTITK